MASMEKREADRLLVLNVMHEASRGDTSKLVGGSDIERLLNYKVSSRRIGAACAFLEARHLIETAGEVYIDHSPQYVRITNLGIAEIEKSLQSPRESTQYLPPALSVVHIEGNNIGSPIQSSSPGAIQNVNSDLRISEIGDFITKLKTAEPQLAISDEQRGILKADIATVEAQILSPKPKGQSISESLRSIRAILEGAGGALVATGLLDTLQHLHF
jgi:hypothetical protein